MSKLPNPLFLFSPFITSLTLLLSACGGSSENTANNLPINPQVTDTTAPTITLKESESINHNAGDVYVDAGYIATDDIDKDSSLVISASSAVNSDVLGSYTLTYTATDSAGNSATVTRTVNVIDVSPPIITLTGDASVEHHLGSAYTDLGATATDNIDTNISITLSGTVNINEVAVYTLTYSATDSTGNKAVAIERTVAVIDNEEFQPQPSPYDNHTEVASEFKTLLDWNNGSGKDLAGWDWSADVAYGNEGWVLAEDGPHGGKMNHKWGEGARSNNKSGRSGLQYNEAIIDTSDIAPSSSSGGSLKVFETSASTLRTSTWWIWYDGIPLADRGVTNDNTDRMSFYLKTKGINPIGEDNAVGVNFHIGTYLCWFPEDGSNTYGTGDGCPYEGVGNQHYYHYLAINSGAWLHVQLDQHPSHLRGATGNAYLENNPNMKTAGKSYFSHLNQFYFDITVEQNQETNFLVDEVVFYSTKDTPEPEQNDESIASPWVGYWQDTDTWQMGWWDASSLVVGDTGHSTFEIRWSTSPITNDNFQSANIVTPLEYGGKEMTGEDYLVRRVGRWSRTAWTTFKLPDEIETNYTKVFFAIKDVSIEGGHIGTLYPFNSGDYHDAPNNKIRTIDYYLKPPSN